MKGIYWRLRTKEVLFNLNWFEYLVLKYIFKKQKYKYVNSKEIRGYEANIVIIDEASYIPEKIFTTKIKAKIK